MPVCSIVHASSLISVIVKKLILKLNQTLSDANIFVEMHKLSTCCSHLFELVGHSKNKF